MHLSATPRKPPLPGLTGIRTFLALGIMLFHFTPPHATYIRPIIEAGFTYNGFFLLMSGFVLAYNYAHRAETIHPGRFYAARACRLYPVYFLSLIVSVYVLHIEFLARPRPEFWAGAVLTPLLLQGWSPVLATFWNTVAWALSTEAVLYLLFPFLIRLRWWPKSAKGLLQLFLLFWMSELILPLTYMALNPDGLHHIDRYSSGFWIRALKYTPVPYMPVFLAGLTLGQLHGAVRVSERTKMWMTTSAFTMILLLLYWAFPHMPYILTHGGLLTPVFGLLVIGLTGQHWMSRLLSFGPLDMLGRASFCLYLLHFNVWVMLHDFHVPERLHVEAWDPWFSYAVMIALAYVAYRAVERPMQRYLLARFVHRTPDPVQTPIG